MKFVLAFVAVALAHQDVHTDVQHGGSLGGAKVLGPRPPAAAAAGGNNCLFGTAEVGSCLDEERQARARCSGEDQFHASALKASDEVLASFLERCEVMEQWAKSKALIEESSTKTLVVYPFGGGDVAVPGALFSAPGSTFLIFGADPTALDSTLSTLATGGCKTLHRWSRTLRQDLDGFMMEMYSATRDLHAMVPKGTLPFVLGLLHSTGKRPLSVQKFTDFGPGVDAVSIKFTSAGSVAGEPVSTVVYGHMDASSDATVDQVARFARDFRAKYPGGRVVTFMKAAGYLPSQPAFCPLVKKLAQLSDTIVSDDSGFPISALMAAAPEAASGQAALLGKHGGAVNSSSSSSSSSSPGADAAKAAAWELSLYGVYEHEAQGGMPADVAPFQEKLKAAYDEALSRSSRQAGRTALKEGSEAATQFGSFRGLMLKGAVGHFPVNNYGYLHDPEIANRPPAALEGPKRWDANLFVARKIKPLQPCTAVYCPSPTSSAHC